jgi:hypothetical protein
MPKPLEIPGPGEQPDSQLHPDTIPHPVLEGEYPAPLSRPLESPLLPWQGISSGDGRDLRRSTSTDRDALPAVQLGRDMPERRLDHSADDMPRESSFDPAQDDSGPR